MPPEREIAAILRQILELPVDAPVVTAGDGSDNWAFEVNGVFIARVRKHRDEHTAGAVEREAALLDIVQRVSPIPVPAVVATEPQAGIIVFRRLPGTSLLDRPPSNPLAFAEPLAAFLASIHALPPSDVEHVVGRDEYPLAAYLADAAAHMQRVSAHLTGVQRHRIEKFLSSSAPSECGRLTFCHNDLGAEHLLASGDGLELTGIIDWSDAAIADPARDIGLLQRDLGLGVADAVLRRTGGDDSTRIRALFHARCGLLEDLAYGLDTSRPAYVTHALARCDEIFS